MRMSVISNSHRIFLCVPLHGKKQNSVAESFLFCFHGFAIAVGLPSMHPPPPAPPRGTPPPPSPWCLRPCPLWGRGPLLAHPLWAKTRKWRQGYFYIVIIYKRFHLPLREFLRRPPNVPATLPQLFYTSAPLATLGYAFLEQQPW